MQELTPNPNEEWMSSRPVRGTVSLLSLGPEPLRSFLKEESTGAQRYGVDVHVGEPPPARALETVDLDIELRFHDPEVEANLGFQFEVVVSWFEAQLAPSASWVL